MAYIRIKDRIGTTINGFYIEDAKRENGRSYVYAVCPFCKNKKWMRIDNLKDDCVSCGCYNKENNYKKPENIAGRQFGRLKAIKPTEQRSNYNGCVIWECECECGNTAFVAINDLQKGSVISCGCAGKENSVKNGKIAGRNVKENFCVEGTNVKNLTAKISKNNISGIKGVHWDKTRKKWIAQIKFKGKRYYLGRYEKKEDAAKVRKEAEEKMFGEFLEWFNNQKGNKDE